MSDIRRSDDLIPIITIQGPTAVGKSDFACKLAESLEVPLISADSRQIYKLMDIGTSKPSPDIQNRIKHYLIDIKFPNEKYDAGHFCEDASVIIENLSKKNKIPIIAGGTGFYIKSLIEGLAGIPRIPEKIKSKLKGVADKKGNPFIYSYLKKVDKRSAERIDEHDLQKMLRALEVFEYTGKPISQFWSEQTEREKYISFDILISEKREKLYQRIDSRVDKMMNNGLYTEFENLLELGYNFNDPGMNTVGYKEFFPFLSGDRSFSESIEKVKQNTRNYAKRQLTWYRKIVFDLTIPINDINISDIISRIEMFRKRFMGER